MSELRTKLIAYTVLIVLGVVGGLSAVSISSDHRQSTKAFERQILVLAKTLSEASSEAVYNLDLKSLRQQVASIRSNEDANHAYILDAQGDLRPYNSSKFV